jgi:hypothetical protein
MCNANVGGRNGEDDRRKSNSPRRCIGPIKWESVKENEEPNV